MTDARVQPPDGRTAKRCSKASMASVAPQTFASDDVRFVLAAPLRVAALLTEAAVSAGDRTRQRLCGCLLLDGRLDGRVPRWAGARRRPAVVPRVAGVTIQATATSREE
jgi:hypothetical protein